jgi:hypothetical protein
VSGTVSRKVYDFNQPIGAVSVTNGHDYLIPWRVFRDFYGLVLLAPVFEFLPFFLGLLANQPELFIA